MQESYLNQKACILQKWRDLFFVHWEVDPKKIQKDLPPGLNVDTFEGKAYLGIISFRLFALRPSALPSIPFFSNFYEINVRTYVTHSNGQNGVWFYSLDANRWLASKLAKRIFHLPYIYSKITYRCDCRDIEFRLKRRDIKEEASLYFSHDIESRNAAPNTLEHFLIERYFLFTYYGGRIYSAHVSHKSYQIARASFRSENLFLLDSFPVITPEHCHAVYSPGVDVLTYPLSSVVNPRKIHIPRDSESF
jgi:uncharacterized protein YqjF (DUF2071 family)